MHLPPKGVRFLGCIGQMEVSDAGLNNEPFQESEGGGGGGQNVLCMNVVF